DPSDIQLVQRELGVNCIALQLKPRLRASRFKLGKDESWRQELEWAYIMLDECKRLGITAIIVIYQFPIDPKLGVRQHDEKFWDDPAQLDEVIRLSGVMSKNFKARGQELGGYQVLSEPVVWREGKPFRPEVWPDTLNRIIEAIRTHDPERWIAVSPGPGGGARGYRTFKPLPHKRIIYNAHMYMPHRFTHQGVKENPLGAKYPGRIGLRYWDKSSLEDVLEPLRTFQEIYDVPVWIGEFSAARWAPGGEQYLEDVSGIFNQNGWGWSYYMYNGSPVWNPHYSAEYASEQNRKLWKKQYVGLASSRWKTLRKIFQVPPRRPVCDTCPTAVSVQ
ncbi:MAG: cellulase family glycosylhydrolase, partial [bacterium]|nr:cellulase family glycosylhydrolase [bacterium]